ncbi:hypothetical protein AGR7C_Cc160129 [Agrobacterium deltaense Zutra 3/1]|uniref:Uncharacterized protein n=1 Tax=Agrobacterium deltaense Zutra 3/1 TaxID=1183427 RepID=A0A1S7PL73_9HYPH|nr:hypothetical protein AGR7C_Cc160129 [Agrobacterium deltaense Zutra 3/1]
MMMDYVHFRMHLHQDRPQLGHAIIHLAFKALREPVSFRCNFGHSGGRNRDGSTRRKEGSSRHRSDGTCAAGNFLINLHTHCMTFPKG